jgi:hypothetical protein
VEPQCLGQGVVEGGAVIMKLLPQRLLGLEFVKKGVQHPWVTQPLLQLRDGNVRCGRRGAGRRRPGVVR